MSEDEIAELMGEVANEAYYLLRQHGLDDWRFEFHNRKTFMGTCFYRRKLIAYSIYFLHAPREEITDMLLHEIAHALVGPGHGHGRVWRAKARELGCRPVTCGETSSAAEYNYRMECPSCGRSWYRYRMRRRNFGAKCPRCMVTIEIYERSRNGFDTLISPRPL